MIKALENNTIGVGLAAAGGAFLLGILGLIVVWAMPPSAGSGEENSVDDNSSVSIATLKDAGPLEQYVVVSERPVFNEDRRPVPVLDSDDLVDDPVEDEYVGAPDVELAGIIITPTQRMVTLKSPDHQQSLVAFEGQPLEGDFGTWQVTQIEERRVTLASDDGEELQLELQVHDAVIDTPPEVSKPVAREGSENEAEAVAQNDDSSDEPMTRAEEIRQRIEERREELRRAAENAQQDEAQNYKDAIQSIINEGPERRPAQGEEDSSENDDQ
ncbi:MAG TPA: hypothetical protein VJ984_11900 [Xanthomonadales bacterium]|nr:hypothetical protein [Xanthomonadales bacterium]